MCPIVWSSENGDTRRNKKRKNKTNTQEEVNEKDIVLKIRRLTAGKGRTVLEIKGLPLNSKWCKELSSFLKRSLGVAGTYKKGMIEIHGENLDRLSELLDDRGLKWKKTGG
ncbi:MAG: hypothetical protein C0601_03580 [Candidatus Muiribacterium halophilum]|uniref:SUI1 domain-containing protein n=1 Tax=Muiribacterium halophilum TaxID=2053465 RepID=A0A2N5ZJM8_MUIH1|nr:MAG: hypothetical protein C0601_03580 [Candidatus Muirbacterium halophilum]